MKCPIHGLTWTLKTFGYLSMSACVVYKERLTNLGAHERVFVFHKHGVDTREWRGAMGGSRSRPGRGLCVTLGRALRPHRHEPCPVRRHTRGRRRSRRGRCTPSLSVSGNSAGFKWVRERLTAIAAFLTGSEEERGIGGWSLAIQGFSSRPPQ